MNLHIKTKNVRYNNKILISDGKFSLGKNDKVNAVEPATLKVVQTTATHKALAQKPSITHEERKMALILFLTGAFTLWYMFQ